MSFLSDIGGLLPTAYHGFKKGVDDETARQQREEDAAYQRDQRARAKALAPLEDEARTSRLKASIEQDNTAGIKGDIERQTLEAQRRLLPQQLNDAEIAHYVSSSKDAVERTQSFLALGGQAIANGDAAGLNKVFGHMIQAGVVASPDGAKLEPPVKSEIVSAPKGSVDFVGQPIEGRAIQATMPDGTKHYVSPKFMDEAYKRQVQVADAASVKTVKPGEKLVVPRTGQVVAEGNERAYGGLVQDEEGNWIDMRPRAGGAAGTGSGKGKAAASPQSAAVGFFAAAAEKAETKLTPTQIAYGQRLAEQISTQRNESGQPIPPAIAAEVAMEVALDPAKIQPQVNVQTGKIEGVFSRRDLGDVVVEPWSPALQKSFTPEQITKAAEELVKAQPEAVRAEFVAAAHDPAARKALLDKVTQEIAAKVPPEQVQAYTQSTLASLTEKLDIVAKNTKPPPKKDDRSILSRFGFGGMTPPESYSPREGVPDDLARRTAQANAAARQRASEQAAKNAAEARASKERKAALEREISWLTEAEVRAMSPSEAAGYLRKYESVLSPDLQRALRRRQ